MAIIMIPDDEAIEINVKRRRMLRRRDGKKEEVVGRILERDKAGRKITLEPGIKTLADIQKLTIIGHGSSNGFLIGPDKAKYPVGGDGIYASEMYSLLVAAGYVNGHSIDVIGCFSDYFAKRLSEHLPHIYVKGYEGPVRVEGTEPGPKEGKGLVTGYETEPGGGKTRYLNGVLVTKEDRMPKPLEA
jgi:hypothetical protein